MEPFPQRELWKKKKNCETEHFTLRSVPSSTGRHFYMQNEVLHICIYASSEQTKRVNLTCKASAHRFFSLSLTPAANKSLLKYQLQNYCFISKESWRSTIGQWGESCFLSQYSCNPFVHNLDPTLQNWLHPQRRGGWVNIFLSCLDPVHGWLCPSRQCFLPLYHLTLLKCALNCWHMLPHWFWSNSLWSLSYQEAPILDIWQPPHGPNNASLKTNSTKWLL